MSIKKGEAKTTGAIWGGGTLGDLHSDKRRRLLLGASGSGGWLSSTTILGFIL